MEFTANTVDRAIEEAGKGNQIAYSFLLDHYWPVVYGYQLKRVLNETEAEDITIETFSKAFERLETYNEQYEFGTWLVSISKNLHVDRLRKQKSKISIEYGTRARSDADRVLDESPTVEDRLITEQNLNTLQKHLKELKPHYQRVLQLRYFNELGYAEISDLLQQPLGTVKVTVLRAKRLLAEKIREGSP